MIRLRMPKQHPGPVSVKSRRSLHHATWQTPIAGTRAGIYSSRREHHMANILAFFSTRTLLQIAFILASTVAMKAWSLGLFFVG
jgi:hypothetical protein